MNWFIFEDSLTDRAGHWFEYLFDFQKELQGLGDEVLFFVPQNASSEVLQKFKSKPALPQSIFRKLSEPTPVWRRYGRIPWHGLQTYSAVTRHLVQKESGGIIFVPTAIVHHLLGWYGLVKFRLNRKSTRILLFFPGLPIASKGVEWVLEGSPTARLMRLLLLGMAKEIKAGKVVLGVETEAMRRAGERVFGLPFTYFPHPVRPITESLARNRKSPDGGDILIGSYGPGRYEKGSDLLVAAIEVYLRRYPASRAKFVLQWVDNFKLPNGKVACLPELIKNHPRVTVISRIFGDGEYEQWLAKTDALALPYRQSSYGLRVSRVVIEALVNGLPAVVTQGTTLAQQSKDFGAAVECQDGDVESVVLALRQIEENIIQLQTQAKEKAPLAIRHFSVQHFRELLVDAGAKKPHDFDTL